MVDKGRTVDTPGFVGAEHHADTLPHEFTLEQHPVTPCGLHGRRYAGGRAGGDVLVVLEPCGGCLHTLLQRLDARLLAEDGSLEGLAYLVAVLIRCRVRKPVIRPAAVLALDLVHRYAVERKDGTVLAQCPEMPLTGERADDSRQLPFEVAAPVIDGRQGQPFLPLPLGCRGQVELLFQLPADGHRALVFVAVGNGTPGFVHPDGNDVQVFPTDVVVAIDDIGLVAEAHAPHVLLRQADKLLLGHAIFRIGIERNVQDGLLCLAVGGQVITERAGKMLYRVGIIALRLDDTVAEKHVGMKLVHLQLVVRKHAVETAAV